MSQTKFAFTEQHLEQIRDCKNLAAAAKTLGIGVGTLSVAIRESEHWNEVAKNIFPQMAYNRPGGNPKRPGGEMQRITLEELRAEPPFIDTSLPHVRAAMMVWRKSA